MTLNGIIAVILRYLTEFGRFGANYIIQSARLDLSKTQNNNVAKTF